MEREEQKSLNVFFVIAALTLAAMARWALYDFQSGDYVSFLAAWMKECADAGGWAYVAIDPLRSVGSSCNYSVMYQYIICALQSLQGVWPQLYLIKSVSVVFDLLCALAVYGIVKEVSDGDTRRALCGFAVTLTIPTVVMNSAAWAQADSIYTFFLLMSFYMLLKEKDLWVWVFFGLSLSIKLQAMFLLPCLVIAWLLHRTKIIYALVGAAVFVLTMVPAYLLGRPVYSLIEVYTNQVGQYKQLSLNYPNIYTVVPDGIDEGLQQLLIPCGVILTMMMLLILAYLICTQYFTVTKHYLLTLAVFTMELVVFMLPVMHERYGYGAGVLAFAYGMFGTKRLMAAIGIEALTIATYARFLFSSTVVKLYPLAAVLLLIIFFLGADLWAQMKEPKQEDDLEADAREFLSEAAAAGVPRVSDVKQALEEGRDLVLQPQEGDVPEEADTDTEFTVPTVDALIGADRDRKKPESMKTSGATYHAPTLAELFGEQYATDKKEES